LIILDTNVVSEVMKPAPSPVVVEWLNAADTASLYLTSITIAEIRYGLDVLPTGKRKQALEQAFAAVVREGFAGRLLGFDDVAAAEYGKLMAEARRLGHPMGILDGQIAAIARAGGFDLATRNLRDFKYCGVALLAPFDASGRGGEG